MKHPALRKKAGEKGAVMMLLMLALPLVLIPLVGLAIDGTRLFIVQAKLSAAVDGAALGAGRLLGTAANTQEIAGEFLNVNFPNGYWGTRNLTPTITYTNSLGTNTINVSATVDSPLLFARIFGQDYSTVASAATATRRNTRVELILDISGSMNNTDPVSGLNVFTTMIAGAKQFIGMFTPGVDEVGLVALSGGSIVAYPTARPYDPSPTSSSQHGPDTSFATSSTAGPMFTQMNAMVASGGTNTSEALALAYIELQKAHNHDVATAGADLNLNSIVLFTDGIPTSMSISPNVASYNALKASSPCVYNPATSSATTMAGWVTLLGSAPPWPSGGVANNNGNGPMGLNRLQAYDTSQTLTYWLGHAGSTFQMAMNPTMPISGCARLGNGGRFFLNDLNNIPSQDLYGNSTSGTGYTVGQAYNGGDGSCAVSYDATQPMQSCQMGVAIWNVTDNVGRTIRSNGSMGSLPSPNAMLPITIFTIGYTGNGGTDAALLKRLANTQDSSSYDSSQPVGQFIQVDSANNLGAAFTQIASSLLRLAK